MLDQIAVALQLNRVITPKVVKLYLPSLIEDADMAQKLEAENVRLREALKSILDLIKGDVVDPDGFVVEEIVRRALEAGR